MSYLDQIARSVSRYQAADRAALSDFQREYFGPASRHLDEEFRHWLFERNPNRGGEGPSLWLCKRDGIVVGQQASIPVVLQVGETEHRAAWLIDWMIRREWRLKGVAAVLATAVAENNEIVLGLGVDDAAYNAVRRAGWSDVGNLSELMRPLDPRALARGRRSSHWLARLTPRLLASGSARIIGRVAGSMTGLSMTRMAAFDERADHVWASARRDYPILVKRDLQTLHWRFDDGPYRHLYRRYCFTRRGQAVGYAVLRLEQVNGNMIGRVVDYLVVRRFLAPALALIIAELARTGAAAAVFAQRLDGCETLLRRLGCLRTRSSHRCVFKLMDPASPLANALAQPRHWFVTPGDSDLDHMLAAEASVRPSASSTAAIRRPP